MIVLPPFCRCLMRWLSLMVLVWFWAAPLLPAVAASDAAHLFELNCGGCHLNGGNIVRRGKTLKLQALERNGFHGPAEISQIITQGKGNMSAYGDRLTAGQIEAVSAYVWEQAQANWQKS
jgi:cytochrome c6